MKYLIIMHLAELDALKSIVPELSAEVKSKSMELQVVSRERDDIANELRMTRGELQPTQSALISHTNQIQVRVSRPNVRGCFI